MSLLKAPVNNSLTGAFFMGLRVLFLMLVAGLLHEELRYNVSNYAVNIPKIIHTLVVCNLLLCCISYKRKVCNFYFGSLNFCMY